MTTTELSLPETFAALEASWPPERSERIGPWQVRFTKGAGKRVSSITAEGPFTEADIDTAEAAQRAAGQTPLFTIRPDDEALDRALDARGYKIIDPVVLLAAPIASFEPPEPMRAFAHWPPLAVVRDIWTESGMTPARFAVMDRASAPKATILGRAKGGVDRASGAAFVSISGRVAMIHAIEVVEGLRRQRSANNILREAARWAQEEGAEWLSLLVLRSNAPALALYASLNMVPVGEYHYRTA